MRPGRLSTFRFTTGSREIADEVAAQLGGEVKQWERGQYEVYTKADTLMVVVPPRDQVISQDYELWSGGGCQRRCDSRLERIGNRPCQCPAAPLERAAAAALNPPQACKPVTRINVMLPDLPGLGVWRLDTHSFYAAVEIGDAAELMEKAREMGVFLPAQLRIDQRERVVNGKTKRYPVPVLEVLTSFRQLVTGQISQAGIAGQLPPVTAGVAAIAADPAAPRAPQATGPAPARPAAAPVTAQGIADQSATATSRTQIEELVEQARGEELLEDMVRADPGQDVFEPLGDLLRFRWKCINPPGATSADETPPPPPEEPPYDESWPEPARPGGAA
jgi:hypothetical protein